MIQNLEITNHSSPKDSQVIDKAHQINIEYSKSKANIGETDYKRNLKTVINKIDQITKGQKPYLKRIMLNILNSSPKNAEDICDFIIAERNEINIKESTVEWHAKVLGQIQKFHTFKSFREFTKEDILNFLNSLRRSGDEDPTNKN